MIDQKVWLAEQKTQLKKSVTKTIEILREHQMKIKEQIKECNINDMSNPTQSEYYYPLIKEFSKLQEVISSLEKY